jgi:hypothetical protein
MHSMKALIAGGTGLIGRALIDDLLARGHRVVLLTRSIARAQSAAHPNLEIVSWDGTTNGPWNDVLETANAVINLAGEPIGSGRWTKARKHRIRSSRIDATRALVTAIARAKNRPATFISASAVGYYGNVPDGDVTESAPKGRGFLADICEEWEREALQALRAAPNIRVLLLRTGIVLDPSAGALKKMLLPFRLFAGGPLGSGRQWFPWIHLSDEVAAIRFLLEHPSASGAFNLSAPNPVTMREFARELGHALRRPSWAAVPASVLRTALGEMASMVLEGQRTVPARLTELGYRFRFPELTGALRDLLTMKQEGTASP